MSDSRRYGSSRDNYSHGKDRDDNRGYLFLFRNLFIKDMDQEKCQEMIKMIGDVNVGI